MQRRLRVIFLLASLPAFPARSSKLELAPVEGKVTLDGKPLKGVIVKFYPESDSATQADPAMGITDDSGVFILAVAENKPGAVVGWNKAIIKWPVRDHSLPPDENFVPI